ncbi:MAG: hypothetical protein J07HX64_02063 [halophilic archaeon J07HX64]|jgi:hypothetical protein|nr:MAG: hypothetical protein J07HX64_02063 [halophilic archaeon J07HX64]
MATETGEGPDDVDDPANTGADSPSNGTVTEEAPLTGDASAETDTDEDEDTDKEYDQFTRSVIVTTCATLLGVSAGIASTLFATEMVGSTPQPDDLLGMIILVVSVVAQFPLYSAIGIDSSEFSTKTQLYVFAMTFFTWFITWAIMLTTRGLL